jgi:N-acyl-D-amino-acid deacylase
MGPWTQARSAEMTASYRDRFGTTTSLGTLGAFFAALEKRNFAVNFASMVGHGTVRATVVGNDDRRATDAELEQMRALVRTALQEGACGMSSGLEYVPGAFGDLDELVGLARELAPWGLPYASHMRNEDDQLTAAVEEALNIGRLANVPVHISHLKAQGERNWWKREPVLEMMMAARRDGIDVTHDRYPYVAYSTGLTSLFPVWSRDGGNDALLARLDDPAIAPRIEHDVKAKVTKLGSWDAVQVTSTASDALRWAEGQRLGSLAEARGTDPYTLLLHLTTEDRARSGMVGFGMSEENTAAILAHPMGMICSDGSALAIEGPLASGTPHPRSFGTFPRVLGHYCRDERVMTLETAVHKMTAMPARRLQLVGRGLIATGAFADLVAFDPATVADTATFTKPHQYPVGIPHVVVNGTFVVRDGQHTGALPGRVLRPNR